jgi:PAS domain S-box-containing protein
MSQLISAVSELPLPGKHDSACTAPDFSVAVLDTFPALIWRCDTNAKCDYFNRTWLEFTGRTLAEEAGDGWAESVHPDDVAGCLERFLAAFHAREPFVLEYRLRRKDGEYRWISDHGHAFNDSHGHFAGYIGSGSMKAG